MVLYATVINNFSNEIKSMLKLGKPKRLMALLMKKCVSIVIPTYVSIMKYLQIWYILHPNIYEIDYCHG